MTFVIRASSFFVKRYLKVTDQGVDFMETAATGGRKRFNFGQIEFILLSPAQVLSFQVGNEVFSIQTNPNKPKHVAAIRELLARVGASREQSVGFPVIQPGQRA